MCCGQKRSELRNRQAQRTVRSVPPYASNHSRGQVVQTQATVPPARQTASPYPHANTQARGLQPQPPAAISTPQPAVNVRYLENSPIRVRGLAQRHVLRVLRFATCASRRCPRRLISVEHTFLPTGLIAQAAPTRSFWAPAHSSFSYSALASRRMGLPASAPFQRARKSR